jgi:hypothetical protein
MVNAPERERWFAFRSERLRVFMEAWLEAHALRAVPRAALPAPVVEAAAPPEPAPPSQDALGARRARNAEWLRRQLRDVAATLGARDLDRLLTFAEFVKARRVARGYSQRHEALPGEEDDARASTAAPAPSVSPSSPPEDSRSVGKILSS